MAGHRHNGAQQSHRLNQLLRVSSTEIVTAQLILSSTTHAAKDSFSTSLYDFLRVELTRGYILEHDEERYTARRQKIHTFMRIPREVESFIFYGVMQCADSFLYIHTFLPVRYLFAVWAVIYRSIRSCFGLRRTRFKLLTPAEVCDLLKGTIYIMVAVIMIYGIDNNRIYHIIKTQSIIKLYLFYNMLEVGDRLLSAFGQDAIDALFWTATEPKTSRRQNLGVIPHFCFAFFYVIIHTALIIFQSTCLNVAINSNNKGLLTIMMSNNFVELKGSVFKKFDKSNLFQLTCSDVRERFHLFILLCIVIIQTMKEFNWASDQLMLMLPDCAYVLMTEVLIDALKHAFITRFNELSVDVYKEYKLSLAYDMTQTRQKHAFSDHSDLVARRMGFIPFPLSIVLIKALYHAVSIENLPGLLLLLLAYLIFVLLRVLNTIVGLGRACDLMRQHQEEKAAAPPTTNTNTTTTGQANVVSHSPPGHPINISTPLTKKFRDDIMTPTGGDSTLATVLFSNSDVDLDDVCLNETLLKESNDSSPVAVQDEFNRTRSVPNLQKTSSGCDLSGMCALDGGSSSDIELLSHGDTAASTTAGMTSTAASSLGNQNHDSRTHRRSESEPFIQSVIQDSSGATISGANLLGNVPSNK